MKSSWMFTRILMLLLLGGAFSVQAQSTQPKQLKEQKLIEKMEKLREEAGLPALGVLVIQHGKIKAHEVTGIRELGTEIPAQLNDQFHLGSCTKAMTATMIARLVEKKILNWDDTLEKHFPDYVKTMPESYRKVTLIQLLTHRSGLPTNLPDGTKWSEIWKWKGSLKNKRLRYTRLILHSKPLGLPDEKYLYSNAGYAVAGFIAEKVTGKSYETLMEEEVFKPLGMARTGFGPAGAAGRGDQPRGHFVKKNGEVVVYRARHPYADNHAVISAAGRAHMPLSEWAKFVNYHATGGKSVPGYLTRDSLRILHRPYPETIKQGEKRYALGWGVTQRRWAGGKTIMHSGTNRKNHCVTWVSLKHNYAIMVTTNISRPDTYKTLDQLVGYMIRYYPPEME